MWKIKNTNSNPVKIAIAKSNTVTVGLFLKPGEFCVCDSRMTASIDAQERRKFIEVDRNFDNSLKLKLVVRSGIGTSVVSEGGSKSAGFAMCTRFPKPKFLPGSSTNVSQHK